MCAYRSTFLRHFRENCTECPVGIPVPQEICKPHLALKRLSAKPQRSVRIVAHSQRGVVMGCFASGIPKQGETDTHFFLTETQVRLYFTVWCSLLMARCLQRQVGATTATPFISGMSKRGNARILLRDIRLQSIVSHSPLMARRWQRQAMMAPCFSGTFPDAGDI